MAESQGMSKKLSPERIAEIGAHAATDFDLCTAELLVHIEALEAERLAYARAVSDISDEALKTEKELAESKAECERLRDELGRVRRLSELGWDVTEVGALKAQIRDRDTLLKNESENYRRCAEECERLRKDLEWVEGEKRALRDELQGR